MYIGIFAFGQRVELAIVIELIIIILLMLKQGAFSQKGVFRTAIWKRMERKNNTNKYKKYLH